MPSSKSIYQVDLLLTNSNYLDASDLLSKPETIVHDKRSKTILVQAMLRLMKGPDTKEVILDSDKTLQLSKIICPGLGSCSSIFMAQSTLDQFIKTKYHYKKSWLNEQYYTNKLIYREAKDLTEAGSSVVIIGSILMSLLLVGTDPFQMYSALFLVVSFLLYPLVIYLVSAYEPTFGEFLGQFLSICLAPVCYIMILFFVMFCRKLEEYKCPMPRSAKTCFVTAFNLFARYRVITNLRGSLQAITDTSQTETLANNALNMADECKQSGKGQFSELYKMVDEYYVVTRNRTITDPTEFSSAYRRTGVFGFGENHNSAHMVATSAKIQNQIRQYFSRSELAVQLVEGAKKNAIYAHARAKHIAKFPKIYLNVNSSSVSTPYCQAYRPGGLGQTSYENVQCVGWERETSVFKPFLKLLTTHIERVNQVINNCDSLDKNIASHHYLNELTKIHNGPQYSEMIFQVRMGSKNLHQVQSLVQDCQDKVLTCVSKIEKAQACFQASNELMDSFRVLDTFVQGHDKINIFKRNQDFIKTFTRMVNQGIPKIFFHIGSDHIQRSGKLSPETKALTHEFRQFLCNFSLSLDNIMIFLAKETYHSPPLPLCESS